MLVELYRSKTLFIRKHSSNLHSKLYKSVLCLRTLLLLLAPAYLALVFFGALVAAFFVGSKVVMATGRYRAGNALAAVVGALVLAAITLIPVVGDLLLYALTLLGTGAAILAVFARRRPLATHPSYEAYVRDRAGG